MKKILMVLVVVLGALQCLEGVGEGRDNFSKFLFKRDYADKTAWALVLKLRVRLNERLLTKTKGLSDLKVRNSDWETNSNLFSTITSYKKTISEINQQIIDCREIIILTRPHQVSEQIKLLAHSPDPLQEESHEPTPAP